LGSAKKTWVRGSEPYVSRATQPCQPFTSLMSRRECLAAISTLALASGCQSSPTSQSAPPAPAPGQQNGGDGGNVASPNDITPEKFGAVGDGITNDSGAFAAMSDFVNARGGGTIVLRKTTYVVGRQASDPTQSTFSFMPSKIIALAGCTNKITIVGNGGRLRCADGLRYGTFDASGQPTSHPLPYLEHGELATPYMAMIKIEKCSGGIEISDLELDGNVTALVIGGPFGDTGRQIQPLDCNSSTTTAPNRSPEFTATTTLWMDCTSAVSSVAPHQARFRMSFSSIMRGRDVA